MTDNLELRWKIQEALREHSRLLDEARPIKARLNDPNNSNRFLNDSEIKTLLEPDKQFEEKVNPLFLEEYPLAPDEE